MTVDERFDRLEQLIESLTRRYDERFDRVEQSVQNPNRCLPEFRADAPRRFQAIHAHMDAAMSIATTLNNQMSAPTRVEVDRVPVHTRLSAAQWKDTGANVELQRRVTQLKAIISKLNTAAYS